MNISRFIFSLTVFSVAFLIGFKAGEFVNPIESLFQSSLSASTKPEVPIPNNNQFNLLIIGVDSVEKSHPNLESIWLAAYTDNSEKVTLIPIFPTPDNPEQNEILAKTFRFKGGQPGNEFWDALGKVGFWWKGYILSDLISTIKMIDALGGVYLDDQLVNGAQMVSSIPTWKVNPQNSIQQQKKLLDGICKRLSQNQTTAVEVINEMLTSRFQGGVQATSLVTKWGSMVATHRNLTCEFPTLANSSEHRISVQMAP